MLELIQNQEERMNKSFKIVLLLFIILYSGPLAAQKFGYIDSEYILNKHPDYKLVLDELKKMSEEWKKEAQNLDQEIKELSTQLKAEEVLLTEEMYQKRVELIKAKQKASQEFNGRVFGIMVFTIKSRQNYFSHCSLKYTMPSNEYPAEIISPSSLTRQPVPLQSFTQIQDMTILSLSWKN